MLSLPGTCCPENSMPQWYMNWTKGSRHTHDLDDADLHYVNPQEPQSSVRVFMCAKTEPRPWVGVEMVVAEERRGEGGANCLFLIHINFAPPISGRACAYSLRAHERVQTTCAPIRACMSAMRGTAGRFLSTALNIFFLFIFFSLSLLTDTMHEFLKLWAIAHCGSEEPWIET